jgi:hypothetical protein
MRNARSAIELAKMKIQIDIIRSCVRMSKQIVVGTALKNSLRNAVFFAARFPFVLPSLDHIRELNQETDIRMYDLKRSISISLKNLIRNDSIFIEDLFWFSTDDLRSGYVLLYPHYKTEIPNYVLFLVEAKDPLDGQYYLPGEVRKFQHVNHVLSTMKGISDKELGLAISCVRKVDLLNELSELKRSLKFTSNE